jgi:hypothetical protein
MRKKLSKLAKSGQSQKVLHTLSFGAFLFFAPTTFVYGENLKKTFDDVLSLDQNGNYIEAYQKMREALVRYSESIPFQITKSVMVTEMVKSFGTYTEVSKPDFQIGNRIVIYMEPVGTTWFPEGDLYRFRLIVDATISSSDGKFHFEKKNIPGFTALCKGPLTDIYLNFYIDTGRYPKGDYTVELDVRDSVKNEPVKVIKSFHLD